MASESPQAPVTLKDVAQAVGVHLSTVSLALRASPKIAASTRERVLETAERLGYRRDPVYFALAARRSVASAPLIVFLTNRASMADFELVPHMSGFLAGAQEQARAMGFACELQLINDDSLTMTELEDSLARRGARGLILAAFMPAQPQVRLDWSRYAVVKIDSWFMPPRVARISHDQQQIVGLACERLHALGYRRIGMAVGQFDEDGSDQLHSTGYRLAAHLLGLPSIPPLFLGQDHRQRSPSTNRQVGAWVHEHNIEAVISNYFSVRAILETTGLRVPQDVACACLCLDQARPDLAGTVMDHPTVGRKAVEMIALQIKTRQFGVPAAAPTLYVEGKWSDANSAPPRAPTFSTL